MKFNKLAKTLSMTALTAAMAESFPYNSQI